MKVHMRQSSALGVLPLVLTGVLAAPPSVLTPHHSSTRTLSCSRRNPASGSLTISDPFAGPQVQPVVGGSTAPVEAMVMDDLFRYDSKGRLFPMMATAIPSPKNGGISAGGKIVTIHLKPGLRWSNGSEITSADIKFGWQVDADPVLNLCAGFCDAIQSISTPERYTAVYHLSRVDPSFVSPNIDFVGNMPHIFPRNSSLWKGNVHQAAVLVSNGLSFLTHDFWTSGPFQPVALKNNRLTLRPMKFYDDMSCGALIATVTYTTYDTGNTPSSASQVQAAAAGRIGLGLNYFPPDVPNLTRLARAYKVHVVPTFTFEHLVLNLDPTFQGKPNPVANPKVRLALALALDKVSIVHSALALTTKQARNIVAWTPWVHTSHLLQPYTDTKVTGQWDPLANGGKGAYLSATGSGQALADARKLLASTPFKSGFTLEMYTTQKPDRLVTMPSVAAQWRRLGVKVDQHPIAGGVGQLVGSWNSGGIVDHGAFQVALFAETGAPDPDPMYTLMESQYVDRDQTQHGPQNANYAGIRDRTIDKAWSEAIKTFNQKTRARDFDLIQERLNQRAYWIPLWYVPTISSATLNLENYQSNPVFDTDPWNSYDWKLKG